MRAKATPIEEQYRLVMECRQSGLSDYNWCLEHNIKPGTFYNWVKRLRQSGAYAIPNSAGRDSYKAVPKQDVVKVELIEEPVKISKPAYIMNEQVPSDFHHTLELHIGNASILISNDIDPILLAQTIQLLQGVTQC